MRTGGLNLLGAASARLGDAIARCNAYASEVRSDVQSGLAHAARGLVVAMTSAASANGWFTPMSISLTEPSIVPAAEGVMASRQSGEGVVDVDAEWWAREGWVDAAPRSDATMDPAVVGDAEMGDADDSESCARGESRTDSPAGEVARWLHVCLDAPPAHLDGAWMLPLWCAGAHFLQAATCAALPTTLVPSPLEALTVPSWLLGSWRAFSRGLSDSLDDAADRTFSEPPLDKAPLPTVAGLTIESAPHVFAALTLRPLAECPLSRTVRCEAHARLEGIATAIAPVLAARTAPPRTMSSENGSDIGTAMRLGLLPTVANLDEGGGVVDGLEPVYVSGHDAPFWQSHVRWFRWFASGDAALLVILLLLREMS